MLLRGAGGARAATSERFYLNDLIAECTRSAVVLATRKSITLKVGPLPELTLTGDEEALKRMLLNLLDNAVKYTPAGGRVNVSLTTHDHAAQVVVTDTGIGIPPEDQAHVFDRFYRVDRARTRAAGGAGLGLAIARHIVAAHGGTLTVTSAPGRGSSFIVTLPLS